MYNSLRRSQCLIISFLCVVLLFVGLSVSIGRPSLTNSSSLAVYSTSADPLCPPKIVVSVDIGRLGNQFFEFLSTRFLAKSLNSEVYITSVFAEIYDRYFIGRRTPIIDWNLLEHRCFIPQSEFVTVPINFRPNPSATHDFIKVNGKYYPSFSLNSQSYRGFCLKLGYPVNITAESWQAIYFFRDVLIEEFKWRPELKDSVIKNIGSIKKQHNTSTIVAVHARRTDYSNYLVAFYETFHVANASYYLKAMDYCRWVIWSTSKKWWISFLFFQDTIWNSSILNLQWWYGMVQAEFNGKWHRICR